MCPETPQFLQETYLDATKHTHSYLLLDLRQDTPDNCRLRSNIFPYVKYHYVYFPKKSIKGSELGNNIPVIRL